jgi:hypothetical protein
VLEPRADTRHGHSPRLKLKFPRVLRLNPRKYLPERSELGQASQIPFMLQRARKRTLSQRKPTPDDEFLILRQTLHAPYWIRGVHKAVGGLFASGQTNRFGALKIQPNLQINRFAWCDASDKRNKERG